MNIVIPFTVTVAVEHPRWHQPGNHDGNEGRSQSHYVLGTREVEGETELLVPDREGEFHWLRLSEVRIGTVIRDRDWIS